LKLARRLEHVRLGAAVAEAAMVEDQSKQPMRREPLGERTQPISPAVQELWGNSSSLSTAASLSGQTPEVRAPGRLDLFSDRSGTFSS
jgi:hypothetical protein